MGKRSGLMGGVRRIPSEQKATKTDLFEKENILVLESEGTGWAGKEGTRKEEKKRIMLKKDPLGRGKQVGTTEE